MEEKQKKNKYDIPQMEIIYLGTGDVIATSGQDPNDDPNVDPEGWIIK